MKESKIPSKRSITNSIKSSLLVLTIIGAVVFSFLMYLQNNMSNKYNEYMEVNIKLSELSVEFSNSWSYFDAYMNTKDEGYVEKYRKSNYNINKEINAIKPFIYKDEDSSVYIRSLSNMIEFYEIESNDAMCETILNEKSYDRFMELKTIAMYINKQSAQLTVSYLNYSNEAYSDTLKTYKNIESKIYIMIISILIFSFIFTIAVSRNMVFTIKKLCKYAENLSNAHWEIPDIEEQRYEELSSLANAFNKMKKSIRTFIDELNIESELENKYNKEKLMNSEKDKLLKETQLMALQTQINPHFLFNTLNTISRMAMFENADETINLIGAVSKILRYSLSYKDKLVHLEEELDMINSYVIIQETRFQDQMAFNFNVEGDIDNVMIPPMSLQPIVENAIIHGLHEKSSGGIINISIEKKDMLCVINIEDNGKGISKEDIKKILDNEEIIREGRKSSGIGVYNVKMRLELYFNRKDLLKIHSVVGQGTNVSILIPLKDGD